MPKDIFTNREHLICGKIDEAQKIAINHKDVYLLELLDEIRYDAQRMENKLISRKLENEYLLKQINN